VLERRTPRFSPKPVEDAKKDDRAIIVDFAGASFREHRHEGVGDGLGPFTGCFDSVEDKGQEVEGLNGEPLKIQVGPAIAPGGFGSGGGLDDSPKGHASEALNGRERRKTIESREPSIGLEFPRLRGPKLPPPSINLGKLGSFTRLGAPGADRREGDRGRPLPDVAVYPSRLDGVVTPVVPTVTPVLTMVGNGVSDHGFRVLQQAP
jgi:hypothetical protein